MKVEIFLNGNGVTGTIEYTAQALTAVAQKFNIAIGQVPERVTGHIKVGSLVVKPVVINKDAVAFHQRATPAVRTEKENVVIYTSGSEDLPEEELRAKLLKQSSEIHNLADSGYIEFNGIYTSISDTACIRATGVQKIAESGATNQFWYGKEIPADDAEYHVFEQINDFPRKSVSIPDVDTANALMSVIIAGVQKAFDARAFVDSAISELTLEEMKAYNVKQAFYRKFFNIA